MSQVPDETTPAAATAPTGEGAITDLESAMAQAAEAADEGGDEGEESTEEGEIGRAHV
jgi:hypothetical protein